MNIEYDHCIDGSAGEGGGQILRTSLSLAMCTGQSVRIENIRAGRNKPGLLRQHLTAVRAAARVSSAQVVGDELGSTELVFVPGAIAAGHYEFTIATAGSTTLVFQTILPALLQADGPSVVKFSGGTHNGMAPSLEFIEQAFVPALARMGVELFIDIGQYGFFPQGGGEWTLRVNPWIERSSCTVLERGVERQFSACAKTANIPRQVGEREIAQVRKCLGWSVSACSAKRVTSPGPGNILSLSLGFENVVEVFEALAEKRLPAERVADSAIAQVQTYLAGSYPVGEYLADQLLLPMVLGEGGSFRTCALSEHTRTNIAVIEQLLGKRCFDVSHLPAGDGFEDTVVGVNPAAWSQHACASGS